MGTLFKKILVANRSEIAIRVMNACRTLNIPTVAVYSDADVNARHRKYADDAVHIGEAAPGLSYLAIDRIIDAAKQTGADAIHPGYGFLAENPNLPRACEKAGITFIGPPPDAMTLMGNKVEARIKMADAGVPLIPGMSSGSEELSVFEQAAMTAGFPVMIKAAAGGGGKGMRIVHEPSALMEAIEGAQREAKGAFGDSTVYLEKYIANPRHIEFQVLADSHGNCVHVFERECSIQRRHQKIIEETPSVALTDEVRQRMGHDAVKVAQAAGYVNAGTVEFLFDESGNYYFLEMNTRIQVEHPITEMVTGTDLVVEQIRIAAGEPLSDHLYDLNQRGHAIECRIYAEDGENNFMPSSGKLVYYREPVGPGIRVDSGVEAGTDVSIDYDPILAKLIVHAPTRELAIQKMIRALNDYKLLGVRTSKRFMIDCMGHPEFIAGRTFTNFIEQHMSGRTVDTAEVRDLAAAVASVASVKTHAPSASGAESGGPQETPTPWDMIGDWEIGDTIHEQA